MFSQTTRRAVNTAVKFCKKNPQLPGGVAILTGITAYFSFKQSTVSMIPGIKMKTPSRSPPVFDLEKVLNGTAKDKIKIISLKTDCPLYSGSRTYQGYSVEDILLHLGINISKHEIIVFKSKDGFTSNIPSTLIQAEKPVLMFRDSTMPPGKNWETVYHPLNGMTDGGPFYLMWRKKMPENHYPFSVTHLSVASFQQVYGNIIPQTKDPQIQKGFEVFADNCGNCHTLVTASGKKAGVEVGPFLDHELLQRYPAIGSIAAYAEKPPQGSAMPQQHMEHDKLLMSEKYIRFMVESAWN